MNSIYRIPLFRWCLFMAACLLAVSSTTQATPVVVKSGKVANMAGYIHYAGAGQCKKATDGQPAVPAVIDLGGNLGQLIHPVTVDGGKTYYVLDRNKDGIHDSQDWIDFNELRTLFFAGAFITESNSTTTTANGVRLRLPSIGESPVIRRQRPVTSVAGAEINPSYDGLLAIWDAFNGSGPLGWSTDNNYYSATSTSSGLGYEVMNFRHGEYYNSLVANRRYIAFEVF